MLFGCNINRGCLCDLYNRSFGKSTQPLGQFHDWQCFKIFPIPTPALPLQSQIFFYVSNLIVYNSDPRSTRPLVSSSNEGYNPRWVNPLTRAHCTYNRPAESTSVPRAHWQISNENIALKTNLFNQ